MPSKQQTLPALVPIPIVQPKIPKHWNFVRADKAFDENIRQWRRLTGDVICTLWIFYNKLAMPGARTDLLKTFRRLPTWYEWLESKGISHPTPLNHFKALGWLPSPDDEEESKEIVLPDERTIIVNELKKKFVEELSGMYPYELKPLKDNWDNWWAEIWDKVDVKLNRPTIQEIRYINASVDDVVATRRVRKMMKLRQKAEGIRDEMDELELEQKRIDVKRKKRKGMTESEFQEIRCSLG